MPLETTQITGTIYDPQGAPVAGGKITIELSHPGSAPDTVSGDDERVAGETIVPIGGDGTVDFTVVPNDVITPVGTIYKIHFETSGRRWREYWSVDSSPDPLEIGDVNRVAGPSADALVPDVPAVSALPAAGPQWHRKHLVLVTATDSSEWVCLLQSSVYTWVQVDGTGGGGGDLDIPVYTSATEPAASAANYKEFILVKDSGYPSVLKFCHLSGDGVTYEFVEVSWGPLA